MRRRRSSTSGERARGARRSGTPRRTIPHRRRSARSNAEDWRRRPSRSDRSSQGRDRRPASRARARSVRHRCSSFRAGTPAPRTLSAGARTVRVPLRASARVLPAVRSALRRALSAVRQRVSVMNGWPQPFVSPKPQPSIVVRTAAPSRLGSSKRDVRDRRLLRALAGLVATLRWAPSAPELAVLLQRDRVTTWRGLARLRRDRLVRMGQRGAWEPTEVAGRHSVARRFER